MKLLASAPLRELPCAGVARRMTVTRAGPVVFSLTALMFKRSTQLFVPVLAALVLGLLVPGPAPASADSVYSDCADDEELDGNYSDRELREALDNLPSDADSYTDCRSIIEAALGGRKAGISNSPPGSGGSAGSGGTGGAGGGDSSGAGRAGGASSRGDADLGPAERRKQAEQREREQRQLVRAKTEAQLGERTVEPGSAGAIGRADTANGLPLPVLLALIALSLLLAAGAALAVKRNPAILGALRRVPLPRRRR